MKTRIWGKCVSMQGVLIAVAVTVAIAAMPRQASAEIECEPVTVKTDKQLNTTWGKELHRLESNGGVDAIVNRMCQPDWARADDYWLYGNYYPLHDNPHTRQRAGADLFVKSRPKQPNLARYLCKDTGANGATPYDKAKPVGVFAYETFGTDESRKSATDIARQVELHVLCVAPDARKEGLGIRILNEAVQRMTAGVGDDKKVRMQLASHVKAQGFYDRLDMTCREEQAGDSIARVYERTLKPGEHIERRDATYYMDWNDGGQCRRVTFGCGNRNEYVQLRQRAFDSEKSFKKSDDAEHANGTLMAGALADDFGCNAESEPIGYDAVIRKLGGHDQ
ncbi:GNAT family N-acetyltransferase [Burkholderia sp. JP2-270]|uniref:GNAT family N-acetyltransferase n=1 Tax=Burkholderia sp. JP2-270 TaxID=2217913 RepID=UPI0013A6A313|nr:GNAT family N-acetyltransferase [Burkholderia sp. JP2-270]